MEALYTAHTIDGSAIFGNDNRQEFLSRMRRHLEDGRIPRVAYEYDSSPHPAPTFPYTVWRFDEVLNEIVGCPFRTFDEVSAHWTARLSR